ncbi:hypothetical protein QM467_10950 [Rhodoblastus sp. 17X3]|uniref:hypothetical protein n=1 Tax=Rhodoblastus sp. 17X3 TaxID=3047026 RepID=UPI0024B70194|nr:hypothetical protein [Rhodoblastus sp. 17X3]MDI9848572.1 hypothetical protein [Rhodoblastus sp. 17X3]
MPKRHLSLFFAASSLVFGLTIAAPALQANRPHGFGPNIVSDRTLNKNIGVLSEQIAWLNTPESDAYQLAQAKKSNPDFGELAQASTGSAAQGYFPGVSDDATLNGGVSVISRLVAWQNSLQGDAFMIAQAEPSITGEDFRRVALASLR